MSVEAIVDDIRKYESHAAQKAPRNDVHESPILYEYDEEFAYDSLSDEYAKNYHGTHESLCGCRFDH